MTTMFTPQARAAAAMGRARKARERQARRESDQIELFAVRRGTAFSWELRQYGGIILACGTECFDTRAAATSAGERVRLAWSRP